VNVKKDILAAITFIATGLLFYVVRSDNQVDRVLSNVNDCGAAETVLIRHAVPAASEIPVLIDGGVIKDS